MLSRLFSHSKGLTLPGLCLALSLILTGCSGGSDDGNTPTGDFELLIESSAITLVEGDAEGVTLSIALARTNAHAADVNLSLLEESSDDIAFLEETFSPATLSASTAQSSLSLRLQIAHSPIQAETRRFTILASDGVDSHRLPLDVTVTPVQRPDVYLLVGQSNMVGFSGDGTREAGPGGADEPRERIRQLNVTQNDQFEVFTNPLTFTSTASNVAGDAPYLVRAEDPLHLPLDPFNSGKEGNYIGLGLSFAKAALPHTTQEIILVPAAWSGSSFCANPDGPSGGWYIGSDDNPSMSNALLFDRAVTRANIALTQSGGILRGILWHQGESDSNENCAPFYQDNLDTLLQRFRSDIQADARGSTARGSDAPIPLIVGTMSRGVDARGDLSIYSESKTLVDAAHRGVDQRLPFAAVSNHDDLTPANGFPCGNESCIHFGAAALREMGSRYYSALRRVVQ